MGGLCAGGSGRRSVSPSVPMMDWIPDSSIDFSLLNIETEAARSTDAPGQEPWSVFRFHFIFLRVTLHPDSLTPLAE